MASFLEERLSLNVREGASYTEDYSVEITTTASDAEYRVLRHGFPKRRWTINFTLTRDNMGRLVKDLYDRVFGKFAGFRVKCLDDFTSAVDGMSAPTKDDQTLQYVSSGVYQLRKVYGLSAPGLAVGRPSRTIYKPVAGTVIVAKNGTLLSSGVSVDTTTGLVTISPAPSYPADTITAGFEFDLPCRFDSSFASHALSSDLRDCGSIDIVELLSP